MRVTHGPAWGFEDVLSCDRNKDADHSSLSRRIHGRGPVGGMGPLLLEELVILLCARLCPFGRSEMLGKDGCSRFHNSLHAIGLGHAYEGGVEVGFVPTTS